MTLLTEHTPRTSRALFRATTTSSLWARLGTPWTRVCEKSV